jgi:predicted DNA-binding transcriptional regulator YafY
MIPLIRSLPKHHSQKEIATTKTYSDFEYYLAPSFDFRQEILREGHELEVIEPESLRKTIHEELKKTLQLYKK